MLNIMLRGKMPVFERWQDQQRRVDASSNKFSLVNGGGLAMLRSLPFFFLCFYSGSSSKQL